MIKKIRLDFLLFNQKGLVCKYETLAGNMWRKDTVKNLPPGPFPGRKGNEGLGNPDFSRCCQLSLGGYREG